MWPSSGLRCGLRSIGRGWSAPTGRRTRAPSVSPSSAACRGSGWWRGGVGTGAAIDDRPSALRYPRGEGTGVELPAVGMPLAIGKGRILREGSAVALLSFGARLAECLKAADQLAALGLPATVADARFAKPLDADLIRRLVQNHEVLITIEEGSVGGFGSFVVQCLAGEGLFGRGLNIRQIVLPDSFIDQDKPEKMYEVAGINAPHIVATVLSTLGRDVGDFGAAERA